MPAGKKRKHKTLTLNDKQKIIQKLSKGEKSSDLARFYGVGRSTIQDIKKKSDNIQYFINNYGNGNRQTLKVGDNPEVEEALFSWYLEERNRDVQITGEIMRKKARELHSQMANKNNFTASDGWLGKFKKRYGIRFLSKDKITRNASTAFCLNEKIQDEINKLGLEPDQVYSASESNLFWKYLPKEMCFDLTEEEVLPMNLSKFNFSFMPCSNASGTHKLDLLVFLKSETLNAKHLPVTFINQVHRSVTEEQLKRWLHETFAPSVKNFLETKKLPQKILLVLTSSYCHSDEMEILDSGGIQILILHEQTAPALQNVVQEIKFQYKYTFLLEAINQINNINLFLENYNLEEAIYALSNAWYNISPNAIISSWKTSWPSQDILEANGTENIVVQEIMAKLCETTKNPSADQIKQWLTDSDEEYLSVLVDEKSNDLQNGENDDVKTSETALQESSGEHNEVSRAFDICIRWAKENHVSSEDIDILKRLQEKALKDGVISVKSENDI